MSSGRRRTDPPNLSTTISEDDGRHALRPRPRPGDRPPRPDAGAGAARQRAAGANDRRQLVERVDDAHVGRGSARRSGVMLMPSCPVEPDGVHAGAPGAAHVGPVRVADHERLVRARRRRARGPWRKKAGFGLATPTAPDGRTKSRYRSSPSSARIPRRFEPQSLTMPMRTPISRTAVSIGSTSGYGSHASGANWLARMRSSTSAPRLDADAPEQHAVVAAPVVLDPPVIAPGVVAGTVVLVPEPRSDSSHAARISSSVMARPSSASTPDSASASVRRGESSVKPASRHSSR